MYIVLFLTLMTISYIFILILKGEKLVALRKSNISIGFVSSIGRHIEELKKRNIILKGTKWIAPKNLIGISILLFILSAVVLSYIIGVASTAVILSIPVLISPVIISKMLIKKNKRKILASLPMYAVNIKNYITEENNIISAIMRASVEPPLAVFVEKFKNNVSKGVNVLEALEILDKDVEVKEFSDLISGIKLCYKNGGDFVSVLEKYILIITKEAAYKEETEEKALSSILTLLIMICLNVIVVFFILSNKEYADIIRTTFAGKITLNLNAISYMVIAGLISKIYKED